MELSSSNIEKIIVFSQKKAFLKFPEMEHGTFHCKLKKKKKEKKKKNSTPRKFLVFQET